MGILLGRHSTVSPVKTYKGVTVGVKTFGTAPFDNLPATLSAIPVVQAVVVGDGDAGISGVTTGGFTLFDRGIGTITSIDIVIFLR